MPVTTGPHQTAEPPQAATTRKIVAGLVAIMSCYGTIFGLYLPLLADLGAWLDVTAGPLNWFYSVYLLAGAVSIPVLSAFGDRFGHRRMLSISIWCAVVGSLLICLAPSWPIVLLGRVLQAAMAAWIALTIALARDNLAGPQAGRAIGLIMGGLTSGYLLGTLVAGPIESLVGDLRITLAIPVMLGVLSGVVAMLLVPESKTRAMQPIDWGGISGLALGLAAILLSMIGAGRIGWAAPPVWLGIACGVLILGVWAWWELRTAHPMMDLRLFTSRAIMPVLVISVSNGFLTYGVGAPLVTFLAADPNRSSYGFGLSSSVISLLVAVITVSNIAGSMIAPRLVEWMGMRRVLSIGLVLAALPFVGMVFSHGSAWVIVVLVSVNNFGLGLLLTCQPMYLSGAVPSYMVAVATGTFSNFKGVGGAIATALFGTLLVSFTPIHASAPTVGGYIAVWLVCAVPAAVALLLLTLMWSARRNRSEEVQPAP